MVIDLKEKQALEDVYQSFLHDERILKMKKISMHRGSNCFIHSFKVAKLAIKRALRHHKGNLYTILVGAILHDYYLYDWREDRSKMRHHMGSHPYTAAENAQRDFKVYDKIKEAIRSHMWPVNIADYPRTKEARIISNADKTIYLREIFCSKRFKHRREERYYKQIEKLFDE